MFTALAVLAGLFWTAVFIDAVRWWRADQARKNQEFERWWEQEQASWRSLGSDR